MHLRKSLARIYAATTVLVAVGAQTPGPIIDLGYAQYQGTVNPATNITNFMGMRYAAAPIGDLRFRAPQPPANVTGVQQATTQPNQCFQASSGVSPTNPLRARAAQIISTEDCLFLNVYFPSDAAGNPPATDLPTVVWIHGGGYLAGNGNSNGEDIIRQGNRGVIVVTIQYRLGVFGFLPGAAVKRNGALNAGLLDQDFALRWVNRHISKFGGDASKVTIWGESAGAGSVLQQVIANGGQTKPQLFRGAMTSSTFLPSQYRYNDRIPEVSSCQFCTTAVDSMACLRAVDANVLETANTNINRAGFFGTFVFVPVVDGTFIRQRATEALLQRKVNGKALFAVTNTFEGTVFVNQTASQTASQYALNLFPGFSTLQANTVGALYRNVGDQLFQVNAVQGESIFICPSYYILRAFPGRSFKGEFAIPPGLHGNDIAYYFPNGNAPPFNNPSFVNAFAQSFTSFVINLDPNIKVDPTTITPRWNPFAFGNTEMLFNKTEAGVPVVRPITTSNDLLLRCHGSTHTPGPIIDLGYAQYQGVVNPATNIANFMGMRYAAAPIGDLRFRAPQPPANVTGVQQATALPNQCFQSGGGVSATNPFRTRAAQIISTEDCLFLNVYFPSDAAGNPSATHLPIVVWIHGGGYIAGNGNSNGEDIIRQSNRGVVVVTIQYRLGVFGFLPGAAVKRNGALNAGLLDQDFALRWVNRHISKFGGDASKVTIWGESAGAGSVLQQVIANGGQTKPQLFRGAMTSSTFLPSQYRYNDRIPELLFSEVAAQSDCTTAADSMACLRAADANVLETVNNNINGAGFFGTFVFVPVVDGTFIRQRATEALLQRKVNGKALFAVTNTFEGTVFVNQTASQTASQYALNLFPGFSTLQANTVGALYRNVGDQLFQVNAVQGESIFICPSYYILRAFPGRSFKGEFAIPPGLHGNDFAYYFPTGNPPPFNNPTFVNAFAQSFTSFVINLDPNIKVDPTTITPRWNPFVFGNTEMLFNKTEAGVPVVRPITTSNDLLLRCQFWESVGALTGQ
ncbi:Alpha/Beta hydrolase protein [Mycena rebaudengoi]|nr:Alpha/Beta hydrolase protein [Mycena rebaudengoi]